MNVLLVGVGLYIALQFAIGVWVSRWIKTEADYLVAGRSLGVVLASFSVFATWFGAETVVGAAGSIYQNGLAGGSADPFGYVLCILLMGAIFAAPLWRRGYTTFADLFRDRYSVPVERCAIALLIPPSVIWAAAQIRAFGQVLSSSTSLSMEGAILLATVVVIAYTSVGGLLADAWTDLIQGIVLILGLSVMGIAVVINSPVGTVQAALGGGRLNHLGTETTPWYELFESWAIPVFGSVFAVELISRVLACRSAITAQKACLLGGALYLAVGMIPVMIGLFGPHLQPNLAEPEQIIPVLAQLHLGPIFFMLFAGALISAILSTVDSALLSAAALVSHNIVRPLVPRISEQRQVTVARVCVLILGIAAYRIALEASAIEELVQHASAFGSAGIVVVTCFGLGTRFGGSTSALVTMAVGLIVWWLGTYCEWPAPYSIALVSSLGSYVLVATCESLARSLVPPLATAAVTAAVHTASLEEPSGVEPAARDC